MSSNGPVEFVSATTLIRDALGTSHALVNWAVNETAAAAYDRNKILQQFIEDDDRDGAIKWLKDQRWQRTGKAAARGTEIHGVAEQLALGQAAEYDPTLEPFVEQYRRYLEEHQPTFLMAEAPVYNFSFKYAGTLDAIAIIKGQTVVVDIKTTDNRIGATDQKGNLKSRPPYPEVALQLCLYRRAEKVGLLAERKEIFYRRYYVVDHLANLEPMPATDGAVCLVISPHDYEVIPVDTSERVWKACRHVIQVARFQTETSKLVFGPPINPTTQGVLL